ncbi:hypothetical protein BC940DRAFT_240465 [Gongronella butleri]|nr:hypothetical protein BC940DRAFT_240465 [Gongronella butleri]
MLACLLVCGVLFVSAQGYEKGEAIPLSYAKVFSQHTRLAMPYTSLPFVCAPQDTALQRTWLTIDQDLLGDRPVQSDIQVRALENVECATLCSKAWSVSDGMEAKQLILDDYQIEW